MGIGGSLVLIAVGAILRFAVTGHVTGIDVQTVGVILMIVGIAALAISIGWLTSRRRTDIIERPGSTTYVTPHDPFDYP